MRTIIEIHDILVKFIEDEKTYNKIAYSYTLIDLENLLSQIYKEFIEKMESENKKNERD